MLTYIILTYLIYFSLKKHLSLKSKEVVNVNQVLNNEI